MDHRRAIDDLRKLAARDEELAIKERALQQLDADVRMIRERAEAMSLFFAGYAEARGRADSVVATAEAEVLNRRREVTEAEASLAAEREEERRELARRALARAKDHLSVAELAVARARAEADRLAQAAQDWQDELPALEDDARRLSRDLPDVAPPPASGPEALISWASHAHAALFVAVRQVETERERVNRESNELASALIGEPTYGSTPAQALVRAEQRVA